MKLLIIIHVSNNNRFLSIIKSYQNLLFTYSSEQIEFDSYLYTEEKLDQEIILNHFENLVYYDEFPLISSWIMAERIKDVILSSNYDGIIVMEDSMSTELAVLLAQKLHYKCMTNVLGLHFSCDGTESSKLTYNNNIMTKFHLGLDKFVVNLGCIKVENNYRNITKNAKIITVTQNTNTEYIISQKLLEAKDLQMTSDILIVVGRGMKNKDDVSKIRNIALNKNFMFGVTRPIAMNAWGKIHEIVGVSGRIYSPKITITLGLSGSAALYVGIENSDFIISVNTNKKAPIVKMSDVSIIDDYEKLIDRLFDF